MKQKDIKTEEQIKRTAKKLFYERGYDAVSMRDIAEGCNVNVALIGYHFKSKQGLYEIIVMEALHDFFDCVLPLFSEPGTTFEQRLEKATDIYTDFALRNPQIPLFILNELHRNTKGMVAKMPIGVFLQTEMIGEMVRKIGVVPLFNILASWLGMILMPIMLEPAVREVAQGTRMEFVENIRRRKPLILAAIKAIIVEQVGIANDK